MPQTQSASTSRRERLEDVARRLAESHAVSRRPGRKPSLLDRLRDHEKLLRDAYRHFAEASEAQLAPSRTTDWLLENFYMVERTLRQIREDMPRGYYRRLPKLNTSPLEGYPRIYAIAREIIGHCEGHLDLDRAARFVRAYQRVTPLTMGELWALPTMLRMGVLESLTGVLAIIIGSQVSEGPADVAAKSWHEGLVDDTVVANCIISLQTLAIQDWEAFFESVSRMEHVLGHDPVRIYPHLDFDTRDRYRGVIEELALATGRDEEEVAWKAIELAREESTGGSEGEGGTRDMLRTAHVGYYLLDAEGRAQLEARLGYRPLWNVQLCRWLRGHRALLYLSGVAFLSLLILLGLVSYAVVAGGTLIQLIAVGLLAAVPTSAIAVNLVNWLVTHTVPPQPLPRLNFQEEGIPAEYCTMVVIPAFLIDADEVQSLLRQLELHYLGNTDPHLYFALLTDFDDAPYQRMPNDGELLEQVKAGIETLNKKYARPITGPFYLFHRERKWNSAENCWMGWERKRGKLVEFNHLLAGEDTSFSVQMGDLDVLPRIKYVITLDVDTILPRDGARRLVATLAHPLNRAEFAPPSVLPNGEDERGGGTVVAGYTVLQPRVEVQPTSIGRSPFAQVFAGDSGLDLYTRAVSDVYQDLFGEGIYAGKGIYDVAAFGRSLRGRVPQNALLSHDLFEGIHGRAGLVTDVILYEDYPAHYLAYTRRLHRWVRGDWQLLPWLLPRVPYAGEGRIPNTLSIIDRWKILDNLRRSLLAPTLLVLLLAGWLWLRGSPLVWTLAALLALAAPVFTGVFTVFGQRLRGASVRETLRSLRLAAYRWLLALAFLLYETLILVDAIVATLYRLIVSHKHLLQWTTAAHTIQLFGKETRVGLLWKKMGGASLLALGLALVVHRVNPPAFLTATPLLLAWLLSPYVAHWISQPIVREKIPLSADQRRQLRHLARRTWLYFEQFVGPDDQWLPPDHFQEDPRGLVAHRTSPTNIGLLLLSTLAAYDLGYVGPLEVVLRLRPTLESINKLERYRGHLMNWYDTRYLKLLPPRYVSTVDSGNLAACLLVLSQSCLDLPRMPVLRWQRWQGLLDTLGVLSEVVEGVSGEAALKAAAVALQDYLEDVRQRVLMARDDPDAWASLLVGLGDEGWSEIEQLLISLVDSGAHILGADTLRELRIWSERVNSQLLGMQSEMDMLLPWLFPMSQPPALFTQPEMAPAIAAWQALVDALPTTPNLDKVPDVCKAGRRRLAELQQLLADDGIDQEVCDWCRHLSEELYSAQMAAESLLIGLQALCVQAEEDFQAMDFCFLFDPRLQVFHLGYHVDAETLDANHYGLLASESRLASLLAIAKGDAPQSHWMHLGRPLTQVDGMRTLLSWSGTMFEYLMPSLVARRYEGTLLDQSDRAVVERQIAYARQRGVPWGISESGYYRFDAAMNYQYRGFGVPGLGLRPGLSEDTVVAPYASLLALSLYPQAVMQNIARFVELGMLDCYGFYEALDYTRSRLPPDKKRVIVRSYMAHHQSMVLLALVNFLQDDVMVRRFHADPRVQSVDLLLQEQMPRRAPLETLHPEEIRAVRVAQPLVDIFPWHVPMEAPMPQVHVLSNGRYSVLITGAGGGYSSWQEVDLTRWRADTTLDSWGAWVYVQDRDSGALWSAGYQPTGCQPESQDVFFYPHKAEFGRRDHDISLRMEVTVSPDDDVEVRRITLTNHTGRPRHLTLTGYGEVVLAPRDADRRHQAFNKLFIESEYLPELNALLFHRRPRSAEEKPIYLAHLLTVEGGREITGAHESGRFRFLGRGRTLRSPAALDGGGQGLSGTTGVTLDPIMALGQEIELKAHTTARVATVTLAAGSRQEALDLAHRYQVWPWVDRAFARARSYSELEMHRLGLATPDVERMQKLLSVLLYPHMALRAAPARLAANRKGQSGLWAYAISGDYPILLIRIGDEAEMGLVRELLQAHTYWRDRQIKVDLVILNERETSYEQGLHEHLHRLIGRMNSDAWLNARGGIFVLRADQVGEADIALLEAAARALVDGKRGPLAEQLRRLHRREPRLPRFVPTLSSPPSSPPPGGTEGELESTPPLARPTDLLFDNGLGGFSADGREYVMCLEPGRWTPAPWVNVIANPGFGFLVSEAGSGYTWAENGGENRLTPWRNDPVADAPGEALYLRDEETAQVWTPTPLPAPAPAPYLIRHGAGTSVFEHYSHGLKQRLRLFVVRDAPVKVVQLRLENTWKRVRRITATFYAEWVLGTTRDVTQQHIVLEFDAGSSALLARNPYSEEFGERVAFAAATKGLHGLTADRTEFLGREGRLSRPAALDRIGLAGTVSAGLDPCAALQVHFDLHPGEAQEVSFLLGQGANRQEALRLAKQYRDAAQVDAAWENVVGFWDNLLGTITVKTPDPAMDLLLNRWLLYQALSCRVWGRSALYQPGGAFGYRDQLQDVMVLVHALPDVARDHILEAARHQFEEGDVLHWWHPPSERGADPERSRGVRTRCSDDLLWLPYVTAHYMAATGDESILSQKVLFLKGDPLEPGEVERYGHYEAAAEAYALYEHCCRALERGMTVGVHGLPLIGSHDWNDGLNRVGIKGKGESVWLGWFLYDVLTRFASLCERVGDEQRAAAYRQRTQVLKQALEEHAWDSGWYRRAYYDDGTPLGSSENDEARIDSIAQSWAVLSGAADLERATRAMEAVERHLVRHDDQLVLLFTPPFDKTARDPGYIKGYPPGIRENGGQYTHAALWTVWAFAELGQGDRAEALFRLLNPIYHGDTPEKVARYRVEPYVVAADVYSVEPHVGRGGWTWYTGSAGWMYRLGVEAILGLRRVGDKLQIAPCIPKQWLGYELTYRYDETVYRVHVESPDEVNRGVKEVILDGKLLPGDEIPLLNDGQEHEVRVLMVERRHL